MNTQKPAPLVVHIIYSLKAGGLENGLVNLINRTPSDRYRHNIICLTEADEFAQRITAPGVDVFQLHKKPGHDFQLYLKLWRLLRTLKPAVVHTRNLSSLEMQAVAFIAGGSKRVHGEHGRDMSDLEGKNRKFNLLRKAMRFLVHKYIAVSQDLHQWLLTTVKVADGKVHQIYNGVDQQKFTPAEDKALHLLPEGFVTKSITIVGTVGRLAEVKNQVSLLNAYHQLVRENPDLAESVKLVLVGDGPMMDSLREDVSRFQLEQSVWLAGDRKDIPDLLRLMDIFVLPSLGEGISNTILEAMATRLPVIASDVGGNPELVEHDVNGLLVPVADDAALAAAIARLLNDSNLRERVAAEGFRRVQHRFNWTNTVDHYLTTYDNLLSTKAAL